MECSAGTLNTNVVIKKILKKFNWHLNMPLQHFKNTTSNKNNKKIPNLLILKKNEEHIFCWVEFSELVLEFLAFEI